MVRGGVPGGWGAEGGRRRVGTGALSSPPTPRRAPPPPPPRGARLVRRRSRVGAGSEPARPGERGRAAPPGWAAPAGLGPALTAVCPSDAAAAAAAGAALPPPPGRGRGADPQRHLRRCTFAGDLGHPTHCPLLAPPFLGLITAPAALPTQRPGLATLAARPPVNTLSSFPSPHL